MTQITIDTKEIERNAKIKNLSDKLLRMRALLIVQKQKLKYIDASVQKYFVERELASYDNFVNEIELEFNMCKYLLKHLEKEN
jgi:hypothetical protein